MAGYSFTTQQDAEDRLTNWARNLPGGNGEQQTFGLTDVGDWNTYDGDKLVNGVLTPFGQTRTHTAVHEIETIDDGNQIVAIEHDAKGNLTVDEDGQTYAWDFDNRLKEVRNANGDLLASHTYDALGRRTTTTAPGSLPGDPPVVTAYVHLTSGGGMGQLLAEYEDNALKRLYTYGSYIDEALTLTRYNANLSGGAETLYYHRDRQYNVIGLTDATGTVIERYAYTPYGERRILAPDGVTVRQVSAVGNPLGHQGLYHDEETDLIYNRARYYLMSLGIYAQRDPLEYIDGLSMYRYLSNNPNMNYDPSGLQDHSGTNRNRGRSHRSRSSYDRRYNQTGQSARHRSTNRNRTRDYSNHPLSSNRYGGGKPSLGQMIDSAFSAGPFDSITASDLQSEVAGEWGKIANKIDPVGDAQGAFRHCYWSCRMTQEIGEENAKEIGDTHEEWGGNPPDERKQDEENNELGREFGVCPVDGLEPTGGRRKNKDRNERNERNKDRKKNHCRDNCKSALQDGRASRL